MKTLPAIADALRSRLRQQGLTQAGLRDAAGIAQRTLTNVLSGEQDFKVSTLLALADRLGLEMILVPKGAAAAVDAGATVKPKVPTRIGVARRQAGGASE
ncbi:helix-turn-helix domain-containing protein [Bordetella petrii]|uniref:helix-turn-helix domain-containing protein n=1 Tax=Bordetella petrii TaxID=94624 RepID=UPI001A95A0F9|nr:helix-turn-helix transcriptional regulator [Bordetella petrii]MBO1111023.1 helix-turn-helix transcriptional regulator [Bordetella petrii]